MTLLNIIIVILVLGLVFYLINNLIPMDQKIKNILNIIIVVILIIWLLSQFGMLGHKLNMSMLSYAIPLIC